MTKQIGYNRHNITDIEVEHGIDSGISSGVLIPGLIPIFEEQTVRIEHGYSVQEWMDEDYDEKVWMVAIRRMNQAMKNHQTDAEIAESERQMKKAAAKGRKR